MTDIVERLRAAFSDVGPQPRLLWEAADEIERLRVLNGTRSCRLKSTEVDTTPVKVPSCGLDHFIPPDERLEAADEIERLRPFEKLWTEHYQEHVSPQEVEIERLRHMKANLHGHIKRLEDENSKLRAENAKLREALEKIADPHTGMDIYDQAGIARAALQKDEGEAAIRAMQSIPQNSSPVQSDGSNGSRNAHAPDAPDS